MTSKIKDFLNKVLFQSKINNIKKEYWRKYWSNFFKIKVLLTKLISFIFIGSFVLGLSFGIRQLMLSSYPERVVLNYGVSFSMFENIGPLGIRLIQVIPIICLSFVFLFVNDWYLILPIPFAIFGGLSNFIDRFLNDKAFLGDSGQGINAVVDYIKAQTSTFNVPDIFIVFGIVCLIIAILAKVIVYSYKEEKESKKRKDETNSELLSHHKEIKLDNDHKN